MRRELVVEKDGKTAVVVIDDGEIRFVHDDDVTEALAPLGPAEIRRASNVEPMTDGRWVAVMDKVDGPTFIGTRRSDLIAREVSWLSANGVPFPAR